jgi:hypothetical protein
MYCGGKAVLGCTGFRQGRLDSVSQVTMHLGWECVPRDAGHGDWDGRAPRDMAFSHAWQVHGFDVRKAAEYYSGPRRFAQFRIFEDTRDVRLCAPCCTGEVWHVGGEKSRHLRGKKQLPQSTEGRKREKDIWPRRNTKNSERTKTLNREPCEIREMTRSAERRLSEELERQRNVRLGNRGGILTTEHTKNTKCRTEWGGMSD